MVTCIKVTVNKIVCLVENIILHRLLLKKTWKISVKLRAKAKAKENSIENMDTDVRV